MGRGRQLIVGMLLAALALAGCGPSLRQDVLTHHALDEPGIAEVTATRSGLLHVMYRAPGTDWTRLDARLAVVRGDPVRLVVTDRRTVVAEMRGTRVQVTELSRSATEVGLGYELENLWAGRVVRPLGEIGLKTVQLAAAAVIVVGGVLLILYASRDADPADHSGRQR